MIPKCCHFVCICKPDHTRYAKLFFGPLINDVEAAVIRQQKDKRNRGLFEKNLMGYTMRTDRYRLVVWKDAKNQDAEPLYLELCDHRDDPQETQNIAMHRPVVLKQLLAQFASGWKGNIPSASR